MAIKFNSFFNYFIDEFKALNTSLRDSEDITTDFVPVFFSEIASYFKLVKESYDINDASNTTNLLCLITEGQLVQETKNPFEIYLQPIGFQFRFDENKMEDAKTLFREFLIQYKEKETLIDGNTVIISPDLGFTEERDIQHGTKIMVVSFSINITILPEVFYSNNASIEISGVEVKTLTLKIQRTTELVPDLRKNISQKFYPNTTIYVLSLTGYYTESNIAVAELIEDDLMSAANFGQPYPVVVYKYRGETNEKKLLNDSMVVKDINVSFVQGSIAAFQVSFYRMLVDKYENRN